MKFINHQHHHDKLLSLYYNNVSQVQGFSLQSDSLLVTTKDKNLWVSTIFQCTLSWEEEEETSRLGSNSSLSDRTIYGHDDGGGGGGGSRTAESYSQCWREKTSKASSWFLAMPKWISSNSSRLFDSNKKTSKYSSPHNHSFFSSEKKTWLTCIFNGWNFEMWIFLKKYPGWSKKQYDMVLRMSGQIYKTN